MTPLSAQSPLPDGRASDVKVLRAAATGPRKRTFASPFRSGRQVARPEAPIQAEPDILSELDGLADALPDSDEPTGAMAEKTDLADGMSAAEGLSAAEVSPEPAKAKPVRKRAPRASKATASSVLDDAPVASRSTPRVVAAPVDAEPSAAKLSAEEALLDHSFVEFEAELDAAPAPGTEAPAPAEAEADADAEADAEAEAAEPAEAVTPAEAAVTLSPADLALHARGADAATWLAGRVGHRMDQALAAANRDLLAMTPSAQANGTPRSPSHQRAAAVLLQHGFGLDKRQPGVRTAFSATVGPNAGGPTALFVIEDGPLVGTAASTKNTTENAAINSTHAAAVLGGALALAAVAPGLGLTVKVLGVPGSEDSSALRALVKDGFLDGATVVLTARGGERAQVGANPPADRQWDVVFSGRAATSAGTLAGEAADAVELARAAITLALRHVPQGASVQADEFAVAPAKAGAPERAGLSVRLHGASPDVLDAVADRVQSCLEAAVLGTGTRMKRTVATPSDGGLRQDSVLMGAYRAAADRRDREVALVADTASSTGLGLISQDIPTLHPSVPRGSGAAAHYALLDAAFGLAVAAAAGCLAGTARDASS